MKTYLVGVHENGLARAILMSTHTIGFYEEMSKIIFQLSSNIIIKYVLYLFFCYMKYVLAHLSRRLIGELIVYPWSGVRRRRPSSSSTMLKHLLLRNRLADQSQILCEASLGRKNEILFAASASHDLDGRYAHIW